MSPDFKMALLSLGIAMGIGLIGTAGSFIGDWLDAHGHKAAARVERQVVDALVHGIQSEQHTDTQVAVAKRAEFLGVDGHQAIQAAVNGS